MEATDPDAKAQWPALWVGLAIFIFPTSGLCVLWRHSVLRGNKKWWGGTCAWTVWWFATLGGTPPPEEMAHTPLTVPLSIFEVTPAYNPVAAVLAVGVGYGKAGPLLTTEA